MLDARDISEANARGARMRRTVAVADELGDLFLTRRETEGPLIRLAQKAHSASIHLVLATQRPEAATISGLKPLRLTLDRAWATRLVSASNPGRYRPVPD